MTDTLLKTLVLSLIFLVSFHQPVFGSREDDDGFDKTERGTKTALGRALTWLLSQRSKDWGWGGLETTQALLAISLTGEGTPMERELTTKQMEIDLVLQLWRHHETPALSVSKIAMYSLALSANCHDPRQFHGHDLIGSLLHHDADSDAEFGLCSLAICSSGAHTRKRQMRRLLTISNSKHTVDSLGGAVLALQCMITVHRNRNLQHYLKKPMLTLARLQQSDGGFGSLHGTALAIQALGDLKDSWNRSAAISWLIDHQGPDGAFFDVATTSEVIMALSNKGLGSIREVDCEKSSDSRTEDNGAIIPNLQVIDEMKQITILKSNKSKSTTSEDQSPLSVKSANQSQSSKTNHQKQTKASSTSTSSVTLSISSTSELEGSPTEKPDDESTKKNENVTVSYSLWVDKNVTKNHTINITTAHNSSFYNVMQLAAEKDENFKFSATEWPNGHYVHTLAGYEEQPLSYKYWLLYRLPTLPDPNNPPGNQLVAPTGVDDLIVEDGEHYLFWYKKL